MASKEEILNAARSIAEDWVCDPEFSLVYESDICWNWSEEDQKKVHDLLRKVRPVILEWPSDQD